jgi:regulator of protease activity HflC (stomatin/prohibitin superfamily)
MIGVLASALITLLGLFLFLGILRVLAKMLGFYAIVRERHCLVYTLFGKVVATLDEPGFNFLWAKLGVKALIINLFGKCNDLDLSLDQDYLRSQPVNSEEGAPMGIGVWYEMYISDPVAFLFKNADPRGSLAANVSNSTVRCLSNLPLEKMLVNRHPMSKTVRDEVSPQSHDWGYRLGSVYIRKVHFRDAGMIGQIQAKVVNRLRQVTSTIKQDGANQVSIITSTADRLAAVEFAKAGAIRPEIVGTGLKEISEDPEVLETLFDVLETQRLLAGGGSITLVPPRSPFLQDLLASAPSK